MKHFILAILFMLSLSQLRAQCDSSAQVFSTTDTLYAMTSDTTVDMSMKIAPNEIVPYFSYYLQEDSVNLRIWVGEFALNRNWVYLSPWCSEKTWNFDESGDTATWEYSNFDISTASTSKPFTLHGGDTVSFYRDFFWKDLSTNTFRTDKYVNDDNVYFSVELINSSNNTRIALLDTFKLSSSTSSKKPCFYSWKPVVSRVASKLPTSIGTVTAHFRVNVATGGSSNQLFMRYDRLENLLSQIRLQDSDWKTYSSGIAANNDCTQSCDFTSSSTSSPRKITVSVSSGQTTMNNVKIIDVYGNVLNVTNLPVSSPYDISLSSSGLYIVAGCMSGSIVCTKLILVQ